MMQVCKRIFLILILLFASFAVKSQTVKDTISVNVRDSIKIENINIELRNYGKQGFITDNLTFLQFGIVIIGALLSIPATPLLVITTGLSIINAGINWKADRRLSKFNVKTEHRKLWQNKKMN